MIHCMLQVSDGMRRITITTSNLVEYFNFQYMSSLDIVKTVIACE